MSIDDTGISPEDDYDDEEVPIDIGMGIFEMFARLTYKSWVALGEYIDNSIQSYETNRDALRGLHGNQFKLRIEILLDADRDGNQQIIITDNAAGIPESETTRAFRLASKPTDLTGLSQYGIGMKSASLWFARNFAISSSALGEDITRIVSFDRAAIVKSGRMRLPVEKVAKPANLHGTRISLTNLNHPIPMNATLGKIRTYLASMYREYIRAGELELVVAGQELSYYPPRALESRYWPNDRGPSPDSENQSWMRRIRIELTDSWSLEDPETRRSEGPPIIEGWVGILERGAARRAGFSLIWKKKVVIGTGSGADGTEDVFKPRAIFGAVNSFASQRLFGEFDVTSLDVTGFKDSLTWTDEQQQEFVDKLNVLLRAGDEPIYAMLNNYRANAVGQEVDDVVTKSLQATVNHISTSDLSMALTPGTESLLDDEAAEPTLEEPSTRIVRQVVMPPSVTDKLQIEIKDQPGDLEWLRVISESPRWRIIMNRSHPFMNSFVNLPDADIEPLIRIAAALGLAEMASINAGHDRSSFIRRQMNEFLSGELASRTDRG